MKQGLAIFDVKGMAKAIRYTEYESIYSAISEIVDNSLEAKSKEILILCNEKINRDGEKVISDIAIIDNGIGMNEDVLHGCLVFGNSPKKETVGMGKFGVGLGQASMYAAPRVEVISWQNYSNMKMVYLDADLMSDGLQTDISAPEIVEVDDWIRPFIKIKLPDIGDLDFRDSGTIVKWVRIDNIKGDVNKFYSNLNLELGRRFRYYINNGCKIGITNRQHNPRILIPVIDPMHNLSNSIFLGDPNKLGFLSKEDGGEPLFEPFISEVTPNGVCEIPIRLERNGVPFVSNVYIKASIIKEKFYYEGARNSGKASPGDTEIGKLVRRYERISVIRVDREIQFDRFGLYESINDPVNRWWRIEIAFSPELDNFFGLSSNKQKVEFKLQYKPEKGETYFDDESLEAKAWRSILVTFDKLLKAMRNRNSKLAKNSRNSVVEDNKGLSENRKTASTPYISTTQILNNTKLPVNNSNETWQKHENKRNLDSLTDILKDYNEVNIEKVDKDIILKIEKVNKVYTPYLNSRHELIKKFIANEDLLLGFNTFLTALTNIRGNFKIYDETIVFEKIIQKLNEEFEYLTTLSEDEL